MSSIISLTTDFGLSDPYVAAVKGSILALNPDVTIVDISHGIPPQDIERGAFVLACAFPYFPAGSIHLAVVDPGVGSERRALAVSTPDGVFIGPDNGILSAALPDTARDAVEGRRAVAISPPAGIRAFALSDSRFHRPSVSPTFHARDIFAPVAARVSLGVPPSELGPEVKEVTALAPFRAEVGDDGTVRGRVVHLDRFGNLITTVCADQLRGPDVEVEIAGRVIAGLTGTYADSAGLSALIGSCGFLEIAFSGGSAETELGSQAGDAVVVRRR
jgi:S-adenosylmethionine hydrolase